MVSIGRPTHRVIWIGEGAEVPEWLATRLPLPLQTFSGKWGTGPEEVGSLIGYWSGEQAKFAIVGPRTTWTISDNASGGVIYWGHGKHHLSQLLAGTIEGINWLLSLSTTQQIDGSSPCSLERVD